MPKLEVVAIPIYFATMGAEYLHHRSRSAEKGPLPGDYERRDTLTSLTMGTGSLLVPLVAPKLLGPMTPGKGRFGRHLVAAAGVSNQIAPEHLQLLVSEPMELLAHIENAGCICLGPLSAVALGDYAAGPSHVLPTNGTARFSSALSTSDFVKKSSLILATRSGLERLAPDVCTLAEAEGLTAHARSVSIRMQARTEDGG